MIRNLDSIPCVILQSCLLEDFTLLDSHSVSFVCVFRVQVVLLFFLSFCFVLLFFSKWYQVDSDQEKEDISVEKMGRKKKIRTTTLPGEALPKKQLSKADKTCAMEEKKLRKEVSFL